MVLSSLTTFYGSPTISQIEFGLLSREQILSLSVCEISSTKLMGPQSVYDPRLGILENGKKCVTCEKTAKDCIGHFGHISLALPIAHPLYMKHIMNVLKCICFQCSHILYTKEQLMLNGLQKGPRTQRFVKLYDRLEKVFRCSHCQTLQPKYTFNTSDKKIYMTFRWEKDSTKIPMEDSEILKIFSHMSVMELEWMGFDPERMHPQNMILQVLPVLPPVARPYVISDTVTCDDDLTIQYVEILKTNQHLVDPLMHETKRQKYIQILKFRIKCLFDNSSGSSKHSNGRPLKGIKKRLTGKEGLLRNNLMGKRVDKSARSVIGPDPTLRTDEIAIPYQIAHVLSYPVRVNQYNKNQVMKWLDEHQINYILRNNGETRINVRYAQYKQGTKLEYGDYIVDTKTGEEFIYQNEKEHPFFFLHSHHRVYRNGESIPVIPPIRKPVMIEEGDVIERKLMDGDILLLNRQPTLHKGSMIAQKVRLRPGKTIRMNLAITQSFNADFDGDEMNLHCPSLLETEAELRELSSLQNHLISIQSSKANIVIVQDTLTACFLMTRRWLEIPKSSFFQMLMNIPNFSPERLMKKIHHYDRLRLSKPMFHSHHSDHENIPYWNGRFLFSILLPYDFFYHFTNQALVHEPIVHVEEGFLLQGAITKANLGGSHTSFLTLLQKEYGPKRTLQFLDEVQFLSHAFLLWHGFSVGISDCITYPTGHDISNILQKTFLKARSIEETLQDSHLREISISRALSGARDTGMVIAKKAMSPQNNFITTVTSGSKGDFFNIGQITGLLGQQYLNGQRIQPVLSGNRRTLCYYPFSSSLKQQMPDEQKYESQGFVRNSFIHGLNPCEFFFHAMTGREGITDTAMKTATSGYIQRRMIKLTEDVQVQYDSTVRSVNKNIIQLVYGGNGLDPCQTGFLHQQPYTTNIERLTQRLNFQHEFSCSPSPS